MKFGLFVIPSSDNVFRCIDGIWTALPSSCPDGCITPEAKWEVLSTIPGQPVCGDYIAHHKHLETLIVNRNAAKLFYGVPNSVDLYTKEDVKKI